MVEHGRTNTVRHTTAFVIPFREITSSDVGTVGGKNASMGEMIGQLSSLGVRVPDGFAVTAEAFRLHLSQAGIEEWVYQQVDGLDITDTRALAETAQRVRDRIAGAPLPTPVRDAIVEAYRVLSRDSDACEDGVPCLDVACRSSATAEDLPTASFAGQHETYLNIRGEEALDAAVRACMASLFTDRAIVYRVHNRFEHRAVALSVGVQRMVRSDLACAGTMFTLDTESGHRGVVVIDGAWGLGETVVQGRVNPDEFWVHKATAKAGGEGKRPVIRRDLGDKAVKLVYAWAGLVAARSVKEMPVPAADRHRFVLTDDEALTLARWAIVVEEHYSAKRGTDTPMDLEWAKDGRTGELFIVQARPETVHSQRGEGGTRGTMLETFRLKGKGKGHAIVTGKSVGARVGTGVARVVRSVNDLHHFKPGEVLVAEMTDPDWEPVLRKAAAVVTDRGGRTCHAAIVSREMGLPCVVGTGGGTEAIKDGQTVTVSCAEGDVGTVYEGAVPFEHESLDPASLPVSPVSLMLNLADPGNAFRLGCLPATGGGAVAGVGLMRIEFLVSNWIGVHPMALVHPERVADPTVRAEIRQRAAVAGHGTDLAEFFVSRLAEGVAQIGAAFFPRPVIVRFSDFKTNEYAGLLGGEAFEPKEENPMIGWRGASRYYDERYREGFALECAAIRRVRETMGLTNVIVMIPFCRTLTEGRAVLAEMARHGLERGKDGMQVYVMCEIPNNVVLATQFSELFDGFSIGSNDLTQLSLGVDRDSEQLAHVFDERDPGVKAMIEMVVQKAHASGRKVGICGEAPSNYPDFAAWLAGIGIDSMSLNPDALPGVARTLSKRREP
ncbi:MAG: phosphoenolpyruvate synthase [Leptolyngbya sp. PLA1]|nr:phosphoenolpyruvate synthase [Leptolyngbya sp. PLA1]